VKDRVKKLLESESSLVVVDDLCIPVDDLCIPDEFPLCIEEASLLVGHKGWEARPEEVFLVVGVCTEDKSIYHVLYYGPSNSQSEKWIAKLGQPNNENGVLYVSVKSEDVDDELLRIVLKNFKDFAFEVMFTDRSQHARAVLKKAGKID